LKTEHIGLLRDQPVEHDRQTFAERIDVEGGDFHAESYKHFTRRILAKGPRGNKARDMVNEAVAAEAIPVLIVTGSA
jgi:hypothetical protein